MAPTIPKEEITSRFVGSGVSPVLIEGRAAEAVGASDVSVVASGTAVLEAGLMQRPLVVVYAVSAITWWLGRRLVKLDHVSLVNLLAGRAIVPELLQDAMSPARIVAEIRKVWAPGPAREQMLAGLEEVRAKLGTKGASATAAVEVLSLLDLGQR